MNRFLAALEAIGLTDDGQISLVNLALYVVLVKLAIAPVVGFGEISALVGVLLSHFGHRVVDNKTAQTSQIAQLDPRVDELARQVSTLQSVMALKRG